MFKWLSYHPSEAKHAQNVRSIEVDGVKTTFAQPTSVYRAIYEATRKDQGADDL
jgi:hypothetical protein